MCLAVGVSVGAQTVGHTLADIGDRVRISVTDSILPSPSARPKDVRQIIGTVRSIEPDTIRLDVAPNRPPEVIPRILIYKVLRSLGRTRSGSAANAEMMGATFALTLLSFMRPGQRLPALVTGYAVGGIVGAIWPYERWEEAWLPE